MYDELVKALRDSNCATEGMCGMCPKRDKPCIYRFASKAADAIEELQRIVDANKTSRWISVEEPPKNDRNIFICHGRPDFKAACVGHYDPESKLFYEDRNWFASILYDAMFWCEMPRLPLPEPPNCGADMM